MRRRTPNVFGLWADTVALGFEAQVVIGMRLAKLAAGGAHAEVEARLMSSEKVIAAFDVQRQMMADILTGKSGAAHGKAIALYHRRVRANRKRLSKG